ncbi:MAG: hypothetical protein RIT04_23 [Candidatus Parcubacteria bacterium]|jgi:hypothetical protein
MANEEKIKKLMDSGTEIAGSVVGGLAGLFIAGPLGVVIGGVSGPVVTASLKKVASEISSRVLAHREEVRIGATLTFIVNKIQSKLDAGKTPRQDKFFESEINNRSTADEILEAGMLAAQREYEEKKIKYYANLIANIAFDAAFSKTQANLLIKTAQDLSWQQICLISLAVRKANFPLRNEAYRTQTMFPQELIFLLQEIFDLYNKNLILFGQEALLGVTDITPSKIDTQGVGAHLYNMMNLSEIPQNEIESIAKVLA